MLLNTSELHTKRVSSLPEANHSLASVTHRREEDKDLTAESREA